MVAGLLRRVCTLLSVRSGDAPAGFRRRAAALLRVEHLQRYGCASTGEAAEFNTVHLGPVSLMTKIKHVKKELWVDPARSINECVPDNAERHASYHVLFDLPGLSGSSPSASKPTSTNKVLRRLEPNHRTLPQLPN